MANLEDDKEFAEDMDLWVDMIGQVGSGSAPVSDDVKEKVAELNRKAARIKDPKKRLMARTKISRDMKKRRAGETVSLEENVDKIFRE